MPSAGSGVGPGVTVISFASGVYLSASVWPGVVGSLTFTVTGTSSVEPSGYVTFTLISCSPDGVPSGGATVNSPVFGSTSTQLGASGSFSNLVPSGIFAGLPSLSVLVGVTLFVSPGLTSTSSYFGLWSSAVWPGVVGSVTLTVAFTTSLEPSWYVTLTGITTSPVVPSGTVPVNAPVFGSTLTQSGAPSPFSKTVTGGVVTLFPSSSVNVGLSTLKSLPASPTPSL